MTNPFVYGEIVPAAAFVDREVELDRLGRDLYAGQKVFLISPRRYGKSSLVRQALKSAARSGAHHRRGAGQQLQLLRRLPRGLRPRAGVGRDAAGSRPIVAERDAVRRPARGAHRARRERAQPDCGVVPRGPDRSRRVAPRPPGLCAARPHRRGQAPADGDRARRVPGRSRRSTAAASSTRSAPPCSSSGRSATSSPAPSRH